jgi:predicted extracellular nuclease
MRRAVLALMVAGTLSAMAACGTASGQTPGSTGGGGAPAGGAALPSALAETKQSCEALGEAYTKNVGPFAESLSKMVAGPSKQTQADAQTKLGNLAVAVRAATEGSTDAQIKSDGKSTADSLTAKSKDAKFFQGIKTPDDVNKVLGPTLKEWLSPVTHHCS